MINREDAMDAKIKEFLKWKNDLGYAHEDVDFEFMLKKLFRLPLKICTISSRIADERIDHVIETTWSITCRSRMEALWIIEDSIWEQYCVLWEENLEYFDDYENSVPVPPFMGWWIDGFNQD